MDITQIILEDHEDQRRMFARLDEVDTDDIHALTAIWTRLSNMLEVHAQAEEDLFYPELLELGKRRHEESEEEETKDAIGDHNDIRDGILKARDFAVGSADWWEGVNAARHANDEHMGEEEHEGLRDFRLHVDLQVRHDIAVRFVAYEAEHVGGVPIVDKDPDDYVEDNG